MQISFNTFKPINYSQSNIQNKNNKPSFGMIEDIYDDLHGEYNIEENWTPPPCGAFDDIIPERRDVIECTWKGVWEAITETIKEQKAIRDEFAGKNDFKPLFSDKEKLEYLITCYQDGCPEGMEFSDYLKQCLESTKLKVIQYQNVMDTTDERCEMLLENTEKILTVKQNKVKELEKLIVYVESKNKK